MLTNQQTSHYQYFKIISHIIYVEKGRFDTNNKDSDIRKEVRLCHHSFFIEKVMAMAAGHLQAIHFCGSRQYIQMAVI